jgi:hypothetical protein
LDGSNGLDAGHHSGAPEFLRSINSASTRENACHAFQDRIKSGISRKLISSAWAERLSAVAELETVATRGAESGVFKGGDETTVLSLFDLLVPRLADGNAKVQTRTLEAVTRLIKTLGDDLAPALSSVVPGLGGSVGSSNEKTKRAAKDAVAALLECVSSHLLVQHVSYCVSYGAARSVPSMLRSLTLLVRETFAEKPALVTKYAVPVAMSTLMNGKASETHAAVSGLLRELEGKLGREALMSHAAVRSAATKLKLEEALARDVQ